MDIIRDRLTAWLEQPGNSLKERHEASTSASLILLEMSIAGVAASGHVDLAGDVLVRPSAVFSALLSLLDAKDALPHGCRVWLRPSLPWPEPFCSTQSLIASPFALRCFTGVVAGASALEDAVFELTYTCLQCGGKQRIFGDVGSAPFCCGVRSAADISTVATIPARTILLRPISPATDTDVASTASSLSSLVAVRLRDDLVTACNVGDLVACTGSADCVVDVKTAFSEQQKPILAVVQMEAYNAHVLKTIKTRNATCEGDVSSPSLFLLQDTHERSLSGILGAMQTWLTPPCSQLVQVALLLSACSVVDTTPHSCDHHAISIVSTESPSDLDVVRYQVAGTTSPVSTSFQRINVLLLSDEGLERILTTTATHFTCHTTTSTTSGATSTTALLPHSLSSFSGSNGALPPMAAAGKLAEANSGIFLMSTALPPPMGITAKQSRAIAEALHAGHASVPLAPNNQRMVSVPVHPTVWCLSSATDFISSNPPPSTKTKYGGRKQRGYHASAFSSFAEKMPLLAAEFDIILDCSNPEDIEVEVWADQYLNSLLDKEEEEDDDEGHSKPVQAGRALRAHVSHSQMLPSPHMTQSAMRLISSYWASLQKASSASAGDGSSYCGMTPPLTFLKTAAKLAAASARLFHRTEILPYPDATLAVALCEETLIAQGWSSSVWGSLRGDVTAGSELGESLLRLYESLKRAESSAVADWNWEEAHHHEE